MSLSRLNDKGLPPGPLGTLTLGTLPLDEATRRGLVQVLQLTDSLRSSKC